MNYKAIELDAADQARVQQMNDKTVGVQRFVQSVVEMGERRVAELQEGGRSMFKDFEKKYGLDLAHVTYQPNAEGTKLVPMYVNLTGNDPSGKQ